MKLKRDSVPSENLAGKTLTGTSEADDERKTRLDKRSKLKEHNIFISKVLNGENEFKQYPVKRKLSNSETPYFVAAHEEPSDMQQPEPLMEEQQPARYRRIDESLNHSPKTEKSQELLENQLDLKRSVLFRQREGKMHKRESRSQWGASESFGVVYSNGKPIGILEPFPQAYEFSPLMQNREGIEQIEPSLRSSSKSNSDHLDLDLANTWENENNFQDASKYSNEKFSGLNDYKLEDGLNSIEKKRDNNVYRLINNTPTKLPIIKRSHSQTTESSKKITNEKITELKSVLDRIQNPGSQNKIDEVEDNLRGILSDMGLIENSEEGELNSNNKDKREVDGDNNPSVKRQLNSEDENLEEGVNKVELVKANHQINSISNERSKREEKNNVGENISEIKVAKDASSLKASENNQKTITKRTNVAMDENSLQEGNSRLVNDQPEGLNDAYKRNKRQDNIMKGLEKSGDLTVSGNKSPLASSENIGDLEKKSYDDKSSPSASTVFDKVKREQDELDYQKEIEKNIQAKINAIKEEVKREIEVLKAQSTESVQRKKRDVGNTLIEEERSELDPRAHPGEKLIPHVRLRRHLNDEVLSSLKNTKRDAPDALDLNSIDSSDYTDLNEEKQEDENMSDYYESEDRKYLAENLKNEEISLTSTTLSTKLISFGAPLYEETSLDAANTPSNKNNVQNSPNVTTPATILSTQIQQKRDSITPSNEEHSAITFNSQETSRSNLVEATNSSLINTDANLLDLEKPKFSSNIEELSGKSDGFRKRRQIEESIQKHMIYGRGKRANAIMPYAKSSFFPYQGEETAENEDEGDEFDEDSFEDRGGVQKRDLDYNNNNMEFKRSSDYQNNYDYNNYQPSEAERYMQKRSLANKFVANLNSDIYENPSNYLYNQDRYVRRKRQNFEQLATMHGGGPMLHHLAAVRERNVQQLNDHDFRRLNNLNSKRNADHSGKRNIKEQENISNLSDADLFGALPASYDGNNLLRFKRVKRNLTNNTEIIINSTIKPST